MDSLLLKILLRVVIYAVLIYAGLSLYFLYIYIRPTRFISNVTPADFGLEYEDITLKTGDNVELAGWFIPQKESNKVIIICHGYPADKGNLLGITEFLAPYYNLLLFDFRALGKSGGRFSTGGWNERKDFLVAVEFLKKKDFKDIGAFGFSMGGAVILMSDSRDIKAMVTDSAYASLDSVLNLIFQNFGFMRRPFVWAMKLWSKLFFGTDLDAASPLKYISRIKTPIFLIHSEEDSQIPVEHAQLLYRANTENELWIISGAEHGTSLASVRGEYERRVLEFFMQNL